MRTTVLRAAFVLAFIVLLAATGAIAQPLPVENHYKVYSTNGPGFTRGVTLTDQFGSISPKDFRFERFSTPADKILPDGTVFPMIDPAIHMDWWNIISPPHLGARSVIVTDQFGQASWTVGDPHYLLLPSFKNTPPPDPKLPPTLPPTWNHYLCYDVLAGPFLGQPVILVDQFGNLQVKVLQPRFLCNPVQKDESGTITPIIDATAHLACYDLNDRFPGFHQISALDQFGYWQLGIDRADCMCTPALKDVPVPVRQSTWGKIKSLYRN